LRPTSVFTAAINQSIATVSAWQLLFQDLLPTFPSRTSLVNRVWPLSASVKPVLWTAPIRFASACGDFYRLPNRSVLRKRLGELFQAPEA
jgi:hypothetical protein